ncbi:hypothetical protein DOTSEDRAFT_45634, partial [Dothistroma septosporum NZE10]
PPTHQHPHPSSLEFIRQQPVASSALVAESSDWLVRFALWRNLSCSLAHH